MVLARFNVFFVLLLSIVSRAVNTADQDVYCVLKETRILPCIFPTGDELVIHWILGDNIHVHSFYHNQDQVGLQNQRFRGRTSLFKDQLSKGNASLKLANMELQDEGRYKCYASTISGIMESFTRLNVDAPIQKVKIEQDETKIICSSEGIYPEPKVAWSTSPPTAEDLQFNTSVQRDQQQLYSITSSLTADSDLNYSCTFSARNKHKTATLLKQTSSDSGSETTISCPDTDPPIIDLIWKFNHSDIILTRNKYDLGYNTSEKWKQHVKDLSESGGLTLQMLTPDQRGIYTCEINNGEETFIKSISLQISEEKPSSVVAGIVIGVILVAVGLTAGAVLFYKYKDRCFSETSSSVQKSKRTPYRMAIHRENKLTDVLTSADAMRHHITALVRPKNKNQTTEY
ncbi:CD276 antigen-like isoform 1-T1 [Pholidichthys leucotaenia]